MCAYCACQNFKIRFNIMISDMFKCELVDLGVYKLCNVFMLCVIYVYAHSPKHDCEGPRRLLYTSTGVLWQWVIPEQNVHHSVCSISSLGCSQSDEHVGTSSNKGALKTYNTQPTIKERGEEAHMRSAVQGLPHTSSPVSSSRSSCRASTSLSFSIWFDVFTTS